MARKRLHQYLVFKGLICEDENLRILARLSVRTAKGPHQEVGPILNLHIAWNEIYASEIGDWLNSLHARAIRDEQHRQAEQRLEVQDPLF